MASMNSSSRVYKAKTPSWLVPVVVAGSILLLGLIFFAVWYTGAQMAEARKTGTVVNKEFLPQKEHQIVVGRTGNLSSNDSDGEYIVTVSVPVQSGTITRYTVWMNKTQYDALKIGDHFDVGPYVAP